MNKLALHKGKFMNCLIIACLFIMQSCRKDNLMPNSNDLRNGVSISEAKQYFEKNLSNVADDPALNAKLKTKTPNWSKSYYYNANGQTMVKVPLVFDNIFWGLGKGHRGKVNYNQSNYLLLYKDSLKNIKAEWVGLYPDSAWAYGDRTNFLGNILIRDWGGKLLKFLKYEGAKDPLTYVRESYLQNNTSLKPNGGTSTSEKTGLNDKKLMSVPNKISATGGGYATVCTVTPIYACTPVVQTTPNGGVSTCSDPSATTLKIVGYDATCISYRTGNNGPTLEHNDQIPVDYEVYIPLAPDSYGGGQPGSTYVPGACVDPDQDPGPDNSPTPEGQSHPEQCINPETDGEGVIEDFTPLQILAMNIDLSIEDQQYLVRHPATARALSGYLIINGFTDENKEFVKWNIVHLGQNLNKNFDNILALKQSSLEFNNKAIRSVEEELGVEEALNANDINFVSKLIFNELTISDYYNNESTVNSIDVLNLNDDEPPFWTKVKRLFKLYMHIEQPRDQQDVQRLDRMNVTYTTVSGDVKRIHDYNSAGLNFIPGYAVLDNIVAEQNYTAAAVNLSIDLFGGSLFKGITGPIFRVAEKYSFTTAELALKFPNIASKLRLFAIKGFNVIKRSNSNKIIIIGEDMANRVSPAKDLFNRLFQNVETFVGSSLAEQQLQGLKNLYGRNLTTEELKSTFMYIENQNWIKEKLAQGYNVIDIGPKIPSTIKSPFYGMERSFIYVK